MASIFLLLFRSFSQLPHAEPSVVRISRRIPRFFRRILVDCHASPFSHSSTREPHTARQLEVDLRRNGQGQCGPFVWEGRPEDRHAYSTMDPCSVAKPQALFLLFSLLLSPPQHPSSPIASHRGRRERLLGKLTTAGGPIGLTLGLDGPGLAWSGSRPQRFVGKEDRILGATRITFCF